MRGPLLSLQRVNHRLYRPKRDPTGRSLSQATGAAQSLGPEVVGLIQWAQVKQQKPARDVGVLL